MKVVNTTYDLLICFNTFFSYLYLAFAYYTGMVELLYSDVLLAVASQFYFTVI